ncbi:type II toxin -antitoxin system TacA 1-like antitoxin [Testudinibacter sp. P27/CKL/0425]
MSNPSRITTRIDLNTQVLSLQATRLSDVASVNSFVVNAAVEKAKAILQAKNIIKLNQEVWRIQVCLDIWGCRSINELSICLPCVGSKKLPTISTMPFYVNCQIRSDLLQCY